MLKKLFCLLLCFNIILPFFSWTGAFSLKAEKASFVSGLDFDLEDSAEVRAIIVYDGDSGLDMESKGTALSVTAASSAVSQQQKPLTAKITETYGAELVYSYSVIFNGIAVNTTYGKLKEIERMSGVEAVYLANRYSAPVYSTEANVSGGGVAEMLDVDAAWASGYKGSGTVIAVIDTGIMTTHEAFNYTDGVQKTVTATRVNALKNSLNGGGVYLNAKVPFVYDYADGDTNINSTYSHGTSVAGIAAGNNGSDFQGVACDAQILGMKIFRDSDGYTDSSIYFAAIEDAVTLGADVINMSLGSANGFVVDYDLEYNLQYSVIMKSLENAGIFLCCACGNEYSQGYSGYAYNHYTSKYGKDAVTADYADYGTVNAPSTYEGAISIASVDSNGGMSDFSSWGITSEFVLKPQLCGVGGRVTCPNSSETDAYYLLSGTSVACPTVSGFFAVVVGYYRAMGKDRGLSDKELYDSIYDTVLSTAGTVYDGDNVACSPRKQGVGIPSYTSVSTAAAVLDEPIISLGDDPSFGGVFTASLTFELALDSVPSDTPVTVSPDGWELVCDEWVYDESLDGYYNLIASVNLDSTVSTDKSEYYLDTNLNTASATVTVTLSEKAKEYLSVFANGAFVEGYVYFSVSCGDKQYSQIKATLTGFYGAWTAAPVFERYDWGDAANAEMYLNTTFGSDGKTTLAEQGSTVYDVLETNVGYNEGYLTAGDEIVGVIGDNLYGYVEYDYHRMAFPTAECQGNHLAEGFVIYPSLLRNASHVIMTVSNADTGMVYFKDDTLYAMKNYYNESISAFDKGTYFIWDGKYDTMDGNYHYVADGTRIKISFDTQIASENAAVVNECEYYMYIDNSAPEFTYEWDDDTKKLKVTAKDNRYISNIMVYAGDYEKYFVNELITDTEPGEYTSYEFDLSAADLYGCNSIRLEIQDYATNYDYVDIAIESDQDYPETRALVGDVNLDGAVDTLDAAAILRFDACLRTFDETELLLADVNKDGEVDSLDAASILKYDAGIILNGFGTVKIQ